MQLADFQWAYLKSVNSKLLGFTSSFGVGEIQLSEWLHTDLLIMLSGEAINLLTNQVTIGLQMSTQWKP